MSLDYLVAMAAVDSFSLLMREIGRSYHYCVEMLAVVGAFYASKVCVAVLSDTYVLIRVHFVPRIFGRPDLCKRYGKWAVVTGGTSGIGLAYARELASYGVDLIMISRNRKELEAATKEITETYNISTLTVVTDFSRGREAYPVIKKALEGKEIGVLVNNVGVLQPLPDSFTSLTESQLWEFINVNIGAANMMAHMVLPAMVQRKKGAIVNVSSLSCCNPCPWYTAYSASKEPRAWQPNETTANFQLSTHQSTNRKAPHKHDLWNNPKHIFQWRNSLKVVSSTGLEAQKSLFLVPEPNSIPLIKLSDLGNKMPTGEQPSSEYQDLSPALLNSIDPFLTTI